MLWAGRIQPSESVLWCVFGQIHVILGLGSDGLLVGRGSRDVKGTWLFMVLHGISNIFREALPFNINTYIYIYSGITYYNISNHSPGG